MINCGYWNIRGFAVHKLDLEIFSKLDIFCLSETWVTNDSTISLPNYQNIFIPAIKTKKRGRASGGLTLYYKNSIKQIILGNYE